MNTRTTKPLIALLIVAALSTTTASTSFASGVIDTLTKGTRNTVVVKKVVPVKKVAGKKLPAVTK